MNLLVLAQIPPPLHGQSVMVQALLEGLPTRGIAVHHVNLRLSRDAADIGRWRLGKIWMTFVCAARAITGRFRHGCDTLYYVPAPGKRGALYRDWFVMLLCRPFFRRLVLHWHAVGLSDWLETNATTVERTLTRWLLGRADLSIVLAESLRADAAWLRSRRIAVVPNGIADPSPDWTPRERRPGPPFQVLFLGLCSEEKGLFAVIESVIEANRRSDGPSAQPAFVFVAAGAFPDADTEARFRTLSQAQTSVVRHAGFVAGPAKRALFTASDCLCLPTRYPAEGQPLVVLEALAHDLPVIATRWRALPEMLTPQTGRLVPVGDAGALVEALLSLRAAPPASGACRGQFLANFTLERHLATFAAVLLGRTTIPND